MIYYLLLVVSLTGAVAKNLIPKAGGKRFSDLDGVMKVNILSSVLGMLSAVFCGVNIKNIGGGFLIAMSIFYGLFTLLMQSFYMTAAELGSVSVCSLIYASCFVIQTVFSAIYGREPCSVLNIIGIAVMALSVAFVSQNGLSKGSINGKSVVFAVFSMLFASGVGIIQKIFASVYVRGRQNEFVFFAFLFMLIFALIIKLCVIGKKKSRHVTYEANAQKKFYIYAAVMAICVATVNRLNVVLIAALPGVLYFPVYAAGTVLCSAIFSRLIFKEKLTRLQCMGIITGGAAIVMMVI